MSIQITLEELTKRAEAGEAAAQYAFAAYWSRKGRREEADRWLTIAAAAGEPEALYTLATRQMHTRTGIAAVAPDLEAAAARGSPSAARVVAALRATGMGFGQDDAAAIGLCLDWAKRGLAPFRQDIGALLLLQNPDDEDGAALLAGAAPRSWAGIEHRLALSPPPLGAAEPVCVSPDIVVYRNAVPRAVCGYVIAHAGPRLTDALVYDPGGAAMVRDPTRTSAAACMAPIDLTLAVISINRMMAAAAGLPEAQGEFLSILRYREGQEYRSHFDFIPAGPDLDRNGQRVKTALLYLNDDYTGGETAFLAPNLKVRGKRGDILVFSNVLADGRGDPASRHAGLPVTAGEKWLASKWFRDKTFDF